MSSSSTGTARLSRWVTVAIILAVALLSDCLLVSLVVGDTFQQEVATAIEDFPGNSFKVGIRSEDDVVILTTRLRELLPQTIEGITDIARVTVTAIMPPYTELTAGTELTMDGLSFQGVEPDYFSIRHLALAQGRLFDAADSPYVAVIGSQLAATGNYKLGSVISSKYLDHGYEVIGILQPNDNESNDKMFTPIEGLHKHSMMAYMIQRQWTELWIGVDDQYDVKAVMDTTQLYLGNLSGIKLDHIKSDSPFRIMHEYVADHTSSSVEKMGVIAIAVGAISVIGLVLMQMLLGARVTGIKRALGATRRRLIWEALLTFAQLSFVGFLLSLIALYPLLLLVGRLLEVKLLVVPETLLYTMLRVTVLVPVCGLLPVAIASNVPPLDAIRDRLSWGPGKRLVDFRQLIVPLAFATAVGTMFLITNIGLATLTHIDATLDNLGEDMLMIEAPPAGTVSPLPTLAPVDYLNLIDPSLSAQGELAWMPHTKIVVASEQGLSRTDLFATQGEVLTVRNLKLRAGTWLNSDREVVIGSQLALDLFGEQSPLGETIKLGNNSQPFTIVGVLEPRFHRLVDFDYDRNTAVYIDWTNHTLAAPRAQFTPRIFFRANTIPTVETAKNIIQDLLTTSNSSAEHLVISNPLESLQSTRHLIKSFSLSTSVMALATVITACASVAALTLIQAREMQKMLALRRACGATRKEVLSLILREVLTLIVIGTVIGLVVAQIGFQWWAKSNELPSTSSWGMVLIGLLCSLAVAVLSATWPAWYVARQAPAELLD